MKKISILLVLLCSLIQLKGQYNCLFEKERSVYDIDTGCSRVFPSDIYDTNLLALSYIPNESTPIITIPVNINIWREDDGTGSWWQDTPAFRDSLQKTFYYLNLIFSQNYYYSLSIPNAQWIGDTKVRFVLDTVYYYNNSNMAYQTSPGIFHTYLVNNYPERTTNVDYHLCLNRTADFAGNTYGYNGSYFTIVTVRQNDDNPQHLYALAQHMAHEFGHNFGLDHTYNDEVTTISSPEFL